MGGGALRAGVVGGEGRGKEEADSKWVEAVSDARRFAFAFSATVFLQTKLCQWGRDETFRQEC